MAISPLEERETKMCKTVAIALVFTAFVIHSYISHKRISRVEELMEYSTRCIESSTQRSYAMSKLSKLRDLQYQIGHKAYDVKPSDIDDYTLYRQQLYPSSGGIMGISDVDKAAAMAVGISKKSRLAAQEYVKLLEMLTTISSMHQKTDVSKIVEYEEAVFGVISNKVLRERLAASITNVDDVKSLEDKINSIYSLQYASQVAQTAEQRPGTGLYPGTTSDQMTNTWLELSKLSAE